MAEDFAFGIGSDGQWIGEAACLGVGDDVDFFAESTREIKRAKAICAGCPVRVPCLVDALERGERYGVWGGTTGDERDRLLERSA